MKTFSRLLAVAAAVLLAACTIEHNPARTGPAADTAGVRRAAEAITTDGLLSGIAALSHDSMEGRAPGTAGEERTVAYLERAFAAAGLAPGSPDGGWTQTVPLVGFSAQPQATLSAGAQQIDLAFPTDYVAVSRHFEPQVAVDDSDLVFVGYGVVAPEYGWDDYKDVDVRGKTIVMLINDPPVGSDGQLDENMFRGEAMTYYGRWTYKYEIASQKGAAAAIIVHETGPAGYPWEVVSGSWGRENFDIRSPNADPNRVRVEAWITEPKARQLFAAAGQDFDALKARARTAEFRPVELNGTASFRLRNTIREVQSQNVVGRLEGSDPELRDEYVIYTAHWDHLGRDTTAEGDQIYNGALDNASGTAGIVEIAKAFSALPTPPRRSILFLAVTAEEQGLLGARYYAENPLYPLTHTVANINIDGLNQWGRTEDVVIVGRGNSTLEDVLAQVTEGERTLADDPEPEKGFYYRSDHFEFAKQGVPALYVDAGTEYVGRDASYGEQKREQYTANDYHKPSDEMKPDWDLSGAVEDLRMLFRLGVTVANDSSIPQWKEGTEFKARRDSMMAGRRD
jgi:Zn-dependent M28 family amino/carboxypeptidase